MTRWSITTSRLTAPRAIVITARILLALVTIQIIFGALVAGLDAGLSYATYPLMDGKFIPDQLYLLKPWWKNHFESVLTVQFQHRMGALAVVACALVLAAHGWKHQKRDVIILLALVFGQFVLGVATLLSGVALDLAITHQGVALLLFAIALRLIYINAPANPRST